MEVMELERDPEPTSSWWRRSWDTIISWWRRQTIVGRSLIGILVIAVIVIICLCIMASTSQPNIKTTADRPHCEAGICLQEEYLIDSMNSAVDPCNDFYEYACGGYIEKTLIPHNSTMVNPITRIKDFVLSQVRKEVEQPSLPTDIEPYGMLRKMYGTCMDTAAIEKSGLDQMKILLKNLGGWPILEKDRWVEIDWVNVTQRIRQYGFDTFQFILMDISLNINDASEYVVVLDEWTSVDDKSYPNYKDFLIKLALLFGADAEYVEGEVDAVLQFRENLSKFAASQIEHSNIGELHVKYPSIAWLDILNVALQIPNVTLTNQSAVMLMSPTYISEFENVIKKTPKRVQANHALFEIIRSRIDCLPNDIRETRQQFLAKATGVTKDTERWRTCIDMVTEQFHVAINLLYMRSSGIDNEKDDILELVSNVRSMFINRLTEVDWIDSRTKVKAVYKAESMIFFLAYPIELQSEDYVLEYYKGLTFDSSYLLGQNIQMSKFKMDKLLSLYGNPVVEGDWVKLIPSFTTTAVYNPIENSLYIPAGIMQHQIYTFSRPKFMNYGGLGYVVAHEITHGFDSVSSWFDNSSQNAFEMKAQCFVEQYNNYTLPRSNLHVDGEFTLRENIADNVGVKTAYLAYLEWLETNKQEPPLPGLNLTDKQLFWLSYANAQCSKHRDSHQEKLLEIEHAPYRFRVLGTLSNLKYFAKDFNCPIGSNMNPVKKCDLW